ncbi:MAG: nucleotidyl transferase AbiEii/AbiGii toxin family protein, partial [Gammaproteobacteria bacterium]
MDERLKVWEILFQRALILSDDARAAGLPVEDWTFGGGTVLMRRHRHRLSQDVEIFINDPQFIGYLTPRLNPTAEALTSNYVEDSRFVKLSFPEGEIDFVASAPLTAKAAELETLFGRPFLVETSTEI